MSIEKGSGFDPGDEEKSEAERLILASLEAFDNAIGQTTESYVADDNSLEDAIRLAQEALDLLDEDTEVASDEDV